MPPPAYIICVYSYVCFLCCFRLDFCCLVRSFVVLIAGNDSFMRLFLSHFYLNSTRKNTHKLGSFFIFVCLIVVVVAVLLYSALAVQKHIYTHTQHNTTQTQQRRAHDRSFIYAHTHNILQLSSSSSLLAHTKL